MTYRGQVVNGNIVVKEDAHLPEGAEVDIFLREPVVVKRRNPLGVIKGLGPDISEEDLAELRREMWSSFPKDFT